MISANAQVTDVNYRTKIQVGKHELIADEPLDLGGNDEGPDPKSYLAASLASCTAITLKMYVSHKQWDVTAINVRVDIEENPDTKIPTFNRYIDIQGTLDDVQRKRLNAVANACPVHKILQASVEIKNVLVG